MSGKFYPTRGKAVVERIDNSGEKENEFGIIYTEKDNELYIKGKVLSVGHPEMSDNGNVIEPGFSEGDIVLYDRRQVVDWSGFHIIPQNIVVGIVTE